MKTLKKILYTLIIVSAIYYISNTIIKISTNKFVINKDNKILKNNILIDSLLNENKHLKDKQIKIDTIKLIDTILKLKTIIKVRYLEKIDTIFKDTSKVLIEKKTIDYCYFLDSLHRNLKRSYLSLTHINLNNENIIKLKDSNIKLYEIKIGKLEDDLVWKDIYLGGLVISLGIVLVMVI